MQSHHPFIHGSDYFSPMKKLLLLALPLLFAYCGNNTPKVDEDKPYKGREYAAKPQPIVLKNACDSSMYFDAKELIGANKYKEKIDITDKSHVYLLIKQVDDDNVGKCVRYPTCFIIAAEKDAEIVRLHYSSIMFEKDIKYLKNIGDNYLFELAGTDMSPGYAEILIYNKVQKKFRSSGFMNLGKNYSVDRIEFEKDSIYITANGKPKATTLQPAYRM